MATGDIKDPYLNFNFHVEIDGITRAAFRECSGFDSTVEITEYREGGDNATPRKLPSMTKFSNITLKWGLADDHDLYDWHLQTIQGDIVRKNGSIVLYNRKQVEVVRWNFVRAWPSKYDAPDFNAEGKDVAIEMIELAHEGLTRA